MYKIIVEIRKVDGKMATTLVEEYIKTYTSLEELGNDGDLSITLQEEVERVEGINNQLMSPF